MIAIRIPGSLGRHNANLKVTAKIGTLGFTQSEVIKAGRWRPGGIMYIWPETVSVDFEIAGRVNSKISEKLKSLLVDEEYFGKISRKSEKNA